MLHSEITEKKSAKNSLKSAHILPQKVTIYTGIAYIRVHFSKRTRENTLFLLRSQACKKFLAYLSQLG